VAIDVALEANLPIICNLVTRPLSSNFHNKSTLMF
jgi:hypothetical protein